jgi:hypothetical protein
VGYKKEDTDETDRIERLKVGRAQRVSVVEFVEQGLGMKLEPWQRQFLASDHWAWEHTSAKLRDEIYQRGYRAGQRDARADICRREGHNLAEVTSAEERVQGIERGACRRCALIVVTQTKTWTEKPA